MSESNANWIAMSDRALMRTIGNFVRHHRLNQNVSQSKLAEDAALSRSTVSLLERGENTSLISLLKVLRVLDILFVMDVFQIVSDISPIEYLKIQQKKRLRARSNVYPEEVL